MVWSVKILLASLAVATLTIFVPQHFLPWRHLCKYRLPQDSITKKDDISLQRRATLIPHHRCPLSEASSLIHFSFFRYVARNSVITVSINILHSFNLSKNRDHEHGVNASLKIETENWCFIGVPLALTKRSLNYTFWPNLK